MMNLKNSLLTAALAAAACLAFALPDYQLFQGTMVLSYAVAILGLNLLTGYNGQISLGHGAFYAIGAYAAAILMEHGGMPYGAAVVMAGLVCLVAGYLFGRPALKLEGLYLALASFALAVALPQFLKHKSLEAWTGGVQGLMLMKPEAPLGWKLSPDQWLYLFSLAVTAVLFVLARNLLASGTGKAIVALREHPLAAQAMGVNAAHVKAMTFAVSAMYTGIGGALSALAVQFVAPDTFEIFLSISLLVGVVVGGVSTLSGAFWGALFVMFIPAAAEKVSKSAPWAVYGVVLVGAMFVMPGGIAGLLARLRVSRIRASAPLPQPTPRKA